MLTFVDLIVTGSVLLIPAILGCMYCISTRSYQELALGGRNLGIVPVALSTVIGFLVFNQNILNVSAASGLYYANGAQILTAGVSVLVAILLSMTIFVPVLHNLKLTSVFEYLQLRFDSVMLRWLVSLLFILVTTAVSAFMIRAVALMIEEIFNIPAFVSILTIGISATIYSTLGGLPLSIFYHAFLTLALLSAATILTVTGSAGGGGFAGVFKSRILKNPAFKFDFSPDPFSQSNDLWFLLGHIFSLTCLYGVHQSQFQRYCAVSIRLRKIQIALGVAIVFAIILVTLLTAMIFSIVASYCESIDIFDDGSGKYEERSMNYRQFMLLISYVIDQLKNHYGVNGLFIAAIGSFVLSLLASILNSLGVITTEDFLRKLPRLRRRPDAAYTRFLRVLTMFYGMLLTGLAFIPLHPESFIVMTLEIFFITIGVIGSAFLVGLFLPFTNKYGTGIGVLLGLGAAVVYNVETHWRISKELDWAQLSSSGENKEEIFSICADVLNETNHKWRWHYGTDSDGWSTALLHISGHLHPILWSIVTILISVFVSILTGGCCQFQRLNRDHFHPLLRTCLPKKREPISDEYSDKPLIRNPMVNSHRNNVDRLSGFPLERGTSNYSLFHQRYETMSLNEVPQ